MYLEIKGMLNRKYSIFTMTRKLNISRNTVYKYIRKSPEEMAEWTASTMTRSKKLDSHKELILYWLREYPDLTTAQVQDWLKEKFEVGESTVRSFVRCLREDYQIPKESSTRDYQQSLTLQWVNKSRQTLDLKQLRTNLVNQLS
jgi:transposase